MYKDIIAEILYLFEKIEADRRSSSTRLNFCIDHFLYILNEIYEIGIEVFPVQEIKYQNNGFKQLTIKKC